MPFLPLDAPASAGAFQLVATIGPASASLAPQLAAAGATAFRLNASHLDASALSDALGRLKRECPGAPVVVDLQGAKMRLALPRPHEVGAGARVRFSFAPGGDLHVPHVELFEQARTGDVLSADDGRVRFDIERAGARGFDARALNGGVLRPRAGVNLERHPVRLSGLTPLDAQACRVAAQGGAAALAFSFMLDGTEAAWLRHAAPRCAVVGKIERREALDRLDGIAARVNAVWICRGDSGRAAWTGGAGAKRRGVRSRSRSRPPSSWRARSSNT